MHDVRRVPRRIWPSEYDNAGQPQQHTGPVRSGSSSCDELCSRLGKAHVVAVVLLRVGTLGKVRYQRSTRMQAPLEAEDSGEEPLSADIFRASNT